MQIFKISLQPRYSLSFFATTLLITLTSQPSSAFTITSAKNGNFNNSVGYTLSNGAQGNAFLAPSPVTQLSPMDLEKDGKVAPFLVLLRDLFKPKDGWTFTPAKNDLAGSFELQHYYVCAPQTQCGNERNVPATGGVGAFIDLTYVPSKGDPTPESSELHWIQRVENNHNATTNKHGDLENIIDVTASNKTNPYYDNGFFAGENFFVDRPYRPDEENDHNWTAELYLVEVKEPTNAPKTVTFYNGIKWGWGNRITACPVPKKDNKSKGSNGITPGEQIVDETEPSSPCTKVPEPSSVLSLLMGGTIALLGNWKKRQRVVNPLRMS
jgi:hypothetical protein